MPHLLIAATACALFGTFMLQYLNALTIATNQAIADTGTTSIAIIEGTNINNKHITTLPLMINLPGGK